MAISKVALLFKVLAIPALMLMVACGGGAPGSPAAATKQSKPLDPQGNWVFTFTGATNPSNPMTMAGPLYELAPPQVTSNGLGAFGQDPPKGFPASRCFGQYAFSGHVSGTTDVNFTLAPGNIVNGGSRISMDLAGTIAADQEHMSGTWALTQPDVCIQPNTGGTWEAHLLTPVTGNWAGTLSSTGGDLLVTAALTENIDQTSVTMGMVTGTITVVGSPCFPDAKTFTLPPWDSKLSPGVHGGVGVLFRTADSGGVSINMFGAESLDGSKVSLEAFGLGVAGGTCDGTNYTGVLSRQ